MKISYLVTCKNETDTLSRLLMRLINSRFDDDEIVILDDFSDNDTTKKILNDVSNIKNVFVYQDSLNNDYGSHKNFGVEKCKKTWIFQLDGDELPSETLIFNIRDIIETNINVELIYVPRINDYRGVTQDHAKQWGWKLTEMEFFRPCENKRVKSLVVQYPDFQGRIFKNDYPRIKWERKLHEKIEGHKEYAFLPADEDLALYHDKSIETQIQTNLRYNKLFSVEDNMGHKVI